MSINIPVQGLRRRAKGKKLKTTESVVAVISIQYQYPDPWLTFAWSSRKLGAVMGKVRPDTAVPTASKKKVRDKS